MHAAHLIFAQFQVLAGGRPTLVVLLTVLQLFPSTLSRVFRECLLIFISLGFFVQPEYGPMVHPAVMYVLCCILHEDVSKLLALR